MQLAFQDMILCIDQIKQSWIFGTLAIKRLVKLRPAEAIVESEDVTETFRIIEDFIAGGRLHDRRD